ncbi:MAG TPA: hypothetical protein VEL11_00500 [Candidatus Bathyarchaeia archaeon]|nr:hypothetical protein [Candidatus Bathyarchaeia archaeon]
MYLSRRTPTIYVIVAVAAVALTVSASTTAPVYAARHSHESSESILMKAIGGEPSGYENGINPVADQGNGPTMAADQAYGNGNNPVADQAYGNGNNPVADQINGGSSSGYSGPTPMHADYHHHHHGHVSTLGVVANAW